MPDWLANGFSLAGLVVVVLQQVPGIVWALHPPNVDPFAHNSGTPTVEILEKTFGIATIMLLVVVFGRAPILPGLSTLFLVGGFVVLAAYYALYVLYYLGFTQWPVMLGMAVFPPKCFLLVALAQGNWLAIVTSVIFGTVHVGLTYANLVRPAKGGSTLARASRDRAAS
jgi:hypothetical protein